MPISTEAIGLVAVSKAYPGVNALEDVTFSVARGRVHGFLGPNGAGKSTTMNIITGLLRESSGAVRLNGIDCPTHKRKTLIGYLPEQPPLYLHMKVKEYLTFVSAVHGMKNKAQADAVKKAIEACGLVDVQARMIGNLSKGFRQRVGIAQTLVFGAEILILDEPTVGLDPVSVAEIRTLIKNLKGQHTVLLSSHLLHEISLICDDITMINKGKLVATGSLHEIQNRFSAGSRFHLNANELPENVIATLAQDFGINVQRHHEAWILSAAQSQASEKILHYLVNAQIGVREFYQERIELEDVFKSAMNQGQNV